MRYWVHHQGVPLGSAELQAGELVVGDFETSEAYASIRGLIREASVALWGMGFFSPGAWQPRVSADALGRAAALPLELRDAEGRWVPADFVNVVERPSEEAGPVVFVRFRHAHGGVTSALPRGVRPSGQRSEPGV